MRRWLLAVSVTAVVLPGCSAGGATSPSPSARGVFRTPSPVSVVEHLDAAHTAVAAIDSSGGSLSVTASNGVTFTLTIPPGAVPLTQRITLQPVAAVDGLPLHGGLLAAVDISPDGMSLLHPAVLTIANLEPVPPGDAALGFTYEKGGANFHLYPLEDGGPIPEMHLLHFSSPGIGAGSPADLSQQAQHPPAGNLAQLEQDAEQLIAQERQKLLLGGPEDGNAQFNGAMKNLLDAFEAEVVAPEMSAATSSGSTYEQFATAFVDLNAWEREWELLGGRGEQYDQLLASWWRVFPRVLQDQVNLCFQHDIQAGIRGWGMVKMAALVGKDPDLDPLVRCLRFRVDFETQQESEWSGAGAEFRMSNHLTATGIPVAFVTGQGGSAPLNYLSFQLTTTPAVPPTCANNWTTKVTADFTVLGLEGLQLDYQGGLQWQLTDFFLSITPGAAVETQTISCPMVGGGQYDRTIYNDNWENLHQNEHIERTCPPGAPCAADFYAISGWAIQSGSALFARKTYQASAHYADVSVTETTVFNIFHDPQGGPAS